ncbi:MAG: glycosyl transferase family protein [Paraglaciecola polaris]|uniref:glycosyl transferase family protein n=1 Tax=Paraglaciecola polaris TaxID=222814 RepID=UPI0030020B04|tara:strand:+ start:2158 stop:3243 length:1086 start_codon:yes stop_codon:yes gene_type:complete
MTANSTSNTQPEFKEFIRIIGRGQRAGGTLTQTQAYQAMQMLINDEITPEQKGAFLMLLRVREETAEELAGFIQAFREVNQPQLAVLPIDIDLGCYAGKRRHLPWFLLAVMAFAQDGKKVFLHGTHEPDSNRLYLKDVLAHLGIDVAKDAIQAAAQLEQYGFCYMDLANINPKLDAMIQLRSQFGLRSCANTLARMLNASHAPNSLQGVFHRDVDRKHSRCAALVNRQVSDSHTTILCFRGEGGEVEYNPERDVTLHLCQSDKETTVDVPASLGHWVVKPKSLDSKQLRNVWQGEEVNDYATHAIIGSLSLMYILTDKLSLADAQVQAQHCWQERDTKWPFSEPVQNDAPAYDTLGQHQAH